MVKWIDVDREGYSMQVGWKELAQWLQREDFGWRLGDCEKIEVGGECEVDDGGSV